MRRLVFAWCAIALAQSAGELQLHDLLSEARHSQPQRQAELLIQADAIADKIASQERRTQVEGFDLTYRDGIYQHDLLKTVIRTQPGTLWGANALLALLAVEPRMSYKSVLATLESKPWQALHDSRLDRIRGEAYETWWSLSKAKLAGDEAARQNAIAAYQRVLQVQPLDDELRHHVAELKARHDTNQRKWN